MTPTPRDEDPSQDADPSRDAGDERADDDEKKKAGVDEEAEDTFPSSDAPSW